MSSRSTAPKSPCSRVPCRRPGPTEPAKTWAYLEALLPEGQALDAMAARVRNARLTAGGELESVNGIRPSRKHEIGRPSRCPRCMTPYAPELLPTVGTPVGHQHSLARADRPALLEEAASLSIAAGEADQVLDELAEGIEQALAQLPAAVTEGWESDTIVDIIAERTARLRTGAALGDDNSAPRNRQARLDELSR